jgi:hypothetical protein
MHDATLEVSGGFISGKMRNLTQYRAGRVITQAFSGMDDQIAAFCTAFNLLKQNFDSRVNLDTALVLSRTTVTIDAISA